MRGQGAQHAGGRVWLSQRHDGPVHYQWQRLEDQQQASSSLQGRLRRPPPQVGDLINATAGSAWDQSKHARGVQQSRVTSQVNVLKSPHSGNSSIRHERHGKPSDHAMRQDSTTSVHTAATRQPQLARRHASHPGACTRSQTSPARVCVLRYHKATESSTPACIPATARRASSQSLLCASTATPSCRTGL